ncbi:hypothetical protein [Peribacillus simplex]|uniref:hypothetical protein n=1 Tax=Peribacillus simplex TaxID=1478 RepID=UPI0024C0B6FE|nr:hypothetical protein [Peribacillus simplex]WHY95608.1 hypothetical protein QNH37_16555 [Peribacillus simplex]
MSNEKIIEQLTRIADALDRISPSPDNTNTKQKEKFDYKSNAESVRNSIELNKGIFDFTAPLVLQCLQ